MSFKGKSDIYLIRIHCAQCNSFLYKYRKKTKGALLRCYIENIIEDGMNGDLKCPCCGEEFARFRIIKNRPAHKIINGKIFIKGHLKK